MNQPLRFTGTGSAFNPRLGNTSAFFVNDNKLFLLDCGETVFERIWYLPELAACDEVYAVITHLHNDHAGSLPALASGYLETYHKKLHIVHPDERIHQLMSLMGVQPSVYIYHSAMPADAASIEAIPVEHVDDMGCYGYIIRAGEWSAYFSGDARVIPETVLKQFLNGEIDRLYQDTSVEGAGHHVSLSYLERVIPPDLRTRVTCMHLEHGAEDAILRAGFGVAGV